MAIAARANYRPRVAYNAISDAATVRGPERYHIGLVSALAALHPDYDLDVIAAPWQHYYAVFDSLAGVRRRTLEVPHGRLRRGLWQLFDGGMRTGGYDLLHLANVLPVPVWISTPITAMVHDALEFGTTTAYSPTRRWVRRRLVGRIVRRARVVTTVDLATAHELARRFSHEHLRPIAIGTGIESRTSAPPIPWSNRERALLFVGGLDRHKRLDLVLRAVAGTSKLRLWIVSGGGPAEAELHILATKLGIEGRIDWLGRRDDGDVRELMARCMALVLASDLEGFGLPILESLQAGTPVVISSSLPFADQWRTFGGYVFPAGDAVGLGLAIQELLAGPERAARLCSIGPDIAGGYTWHRVAAAMNSILRAVLGLKSSQSEVPLS